MNDTTTDITHTRGDTFVRSMAFADSLGVPINLTNSTIVMSIRKNIVDSSPTLTQTAVLTDPTHGLATITATATAMAALAIGAYFYDIQWTDSTGVVTTVLKGNFYITFDVTHA